MISNNLTYDNPKAAYLIFGSVLILVFFWFYHRYLQTILVSFFYNKEITYRRYWLKAICLSLGWFFLTLALMAPKGNPHYPRMAEPKTPKSGLGTMEVRRKAHQFIFMVDGSNSMKVKDGRNNESRFDFAKEIIDHMVSQFQGESGSLYTFTSQLEREVPATMDYFFLRMMLRNLSYNENGVEGTDLKKAIESIVEEESKRNASNELKTVVVISDGGDNAFQLLPENQKSSWLNKISEDLKKLPLNFRILTIGVGTKKGGQIPDLIYQGESINSSLEEEVLQRISLVGRGKYYAAHEYGTIDLTRDIFNFLSQDDPYQTLSESQQSTQAALIYDDYFFYPLGLAILLMAAGFLLTENRVKKSLVILFWFFPLFVNGDDFSQWKEPMNHARMDVQANQFRQALNIYENLLSFSLPSDQQALLIYNIALVKFKEKQWDESLKSLEPLLEQTDSPIYLKVKIHHLAFLAKIQKLNDFMNESTIGWKEILEIKRLYHQIQMLNESILELDCELQRYLGYSSCRAIHKMDEDVSQAANIYSLLLQNFYTHAFSILDLKDQMALINDAFQKINTGVQKLSVATKEQQEFIFNQILTWQPLFRSFIEQLAKDPEIKINSSFRSFEESINQLFANLHQKDESLKALDQSQEYFIKISVEIWKKIRLYEFAAFLYQQYQLRFLEEQSSKTTDLWNQIFQEISKETPDSKENQSEWENIQKSFAESQTFEKSQKTELAKFFYQEGLSRLKLWEIELNPHLSEVEQNLLKMIESVRFLQLLPPEILPSILKTTQLNLAASQELLYTQIQKQQKQAFEEKQVCQFHPWNEVIPLLEKGRLEVAQGELKDALDQWQRAYEKMHKSPSAQSCHENSVQSGGASSQTSEAQNDQRLEELQLMENEDRKLKPSHKILEQGLRPW